MSDKTKQTANAGGKHGAQDSEDMNQTIIDLRLQVIAEKEATIAANQATNAANAAHNAAIAANLAEKARYLEEKEKQPQPIPQQQPQQSQGCSMTKKAFEVLQLKEQSSIALVLFIEAALNLESFWGREDERTIVALLLGKLLQLRLAVSSR